MMQTTDRSKNTAYVYYAKLTDRLGYDHADATQTGELLLNKGLAELYGIDLKKEERDKGPQGKPYLPLHPEVHYNISHSGKYVICVLAGVPVGIDIQEKRITNIQRVGKRIFPPDKYREFLKSEDMQDEFFRQWVQRESYLKWTGEGITKDLRELKTEGWHQFIHLHRDYMCAIWSGNPLEVRIKEV